MKFVHLRYHRNQDVSHQNTEGICNLGGATIAFDKRDDAKEVWWSFALCREDENFSRSVGRREASKRFDTGDYYIYKYDGEFDVNLFLRTVAKRKVYEKIARSYWFARLWDMGYPHYHNVDYFLY